MVLGNRLWPWVYGLVIAIGAYFGNGQGYGGGLFGAFWGFRSFFTWSISSDILLRGIVIASNWSIIGSLGWRVILIGRGGE